MAKDEHDSDEGLMVRICGGDHQAFAVLVRRYTNMFFAAAYRMSGDAQEAEDVVQEAFLKLWRKPQAFDPMKGVKFSTWFYRVVTNMAIDHTRRRKWQGGAEMLDVMVDDTMLADGSLIEREQQGRLEKAIQDLPERQKVALNLCFYEGLSNKEAADILGVGVKALESLLMRAKAKLRGVLKGGLVKDEAGKTG